MMEIRTRPEARTVPALLRDLRDETTTLLRQEFALAKTEMSERTSRFARNLAYLAVGAAVLYAGVLFLLWAATIGVRLGLEAWRPDLAAYTAWLAPLLVGALVALIGVILLVKAVRTIKRMRVVPEKTIQRLKEDKEWAQRKAA